MEKRSQCCRQPGSASAKETLSKTDLQTLPEKSRVREWVRFRSPFSSPAQVRLLQGTHTLKAQWPIL